MSVPVKGQLPIRMVIPVKKDIPIHETLKLKFNSPVKAHLKNVFRVPIDTLVSSDITLDQKLTIPIKQALMSVPPLGPASRSAYDGEFYRHWTRSN
jgi:hypothetical protein